MQAFVTFNGSSPTTPMAIKIIIEDESAFVRKEMTAPHVGTVRQSIANATLLVRPKVVNVAPGQPGSSHRRKRSLNR
ncbi:MAG: hypothetical protein HKL96_14145 [Phycisphaerales bacterium]|nr:hypothetical protein [Phycisphaerales bacterium]